MRWWRSVSESAFFPASPCKRATADSELYLFHLVSLAVSANCWRGTQFTVQP
jgi:hypothetical protein